MDLKIEMRKKKDIKTGLLKSSSYMSDGRMPN